MKSVVLALIFVTSSVGFAAPKAVEDAANRMKASDVRTVITEVTEDSACVAKGSYNVDLQVKVALGYSRGNRPIYKWQSVKIINVEKDGSVMEVCME